jgi:hypothetical protein
MKKHFDCFINQWYKNRIIADRAWIGERAAWLLMIGMQ